MIEALTDNSKNDDVKNGIVLENTSGNISFENVYFSYTNKNKLIEDLSCNFPAKKKIAIVGATGSGKTTLINLLLRFYDVDAGTINIDNMHIGKCYLIFSYFANDLSFSSPSKLCHRQSHL